MDDRAYDSSSTQLPKVPPRVVRRRDLIALLTILLVLLCRAASLGIESFKLNKVTRNTFDETGPNIQPSTTSPLLSKSSTTVTVVFGLSGNHPGFLSEFEVALKSLLLNAPIHSSLDVHIMADQLAYESLTQVFQKTQVATWITISPITITTHNVQPLTPLWSTRIEKAMHQFTLDIPNAFPPIGAYFRLFANEVVSSNASHALYMDTDVVVMANLDAVWTHVNRDPEALFHWGKTMCSGFLILKLDALPEILNMTEYIDFHALRGKVQTTPNDQIIFQAITAIHPERVAILPPEWDVSVAQWELRQIRDQIAEKMPAIGMMHFNQGATTKEAFYNSHLLLKEERYRATYGLAHYYVNIPWSWARFTAESMTQGKGYPLVVHHHAGGE